jgi:hypothetical protein
MHYFDRLTFANSEFFLCFGKRPQSANILITGLIDAQEALLFDSPILFGAESTIFQYELKEKRYFRND